MAIQKGWGGRESLQKVDKLSSAVLSWCSNDKARLYIDDLENILDENMVLSFNAEIEDDNIEEELEVGWATRSTMTSSAVVFGMAVGQVKLEARREAGFANPLPGSISRSLPLVLQVETFLIRAAAWSGRVLHLFKQ